MAPLGVLALGDSITNAGGELQWGVALQSWALWTARGLGLPYTGHAVDGARAADVVAVQLPRHGATARPDGPFEVGALYIGANDVRAADWDPEGFARDHRRALGFLRQRCARTLVLTLPLGLGRPPSPDRVAAANAILERHARELGALLVDLRGFGARNQVMVDGVHPTAFGQIAIAERALRVLAADGLPTRVPPASLIAWETTRWERLRSDATYLYRQGKESLRAIRDRG